LGGEKVLRPLVDAFYNRVAQHPNLRPLFPEDFTDVKERQFRFLTQFLGGPALYSMKHGAPMMRARHLRFPIDEQRAQDWLSCMAGAMDDIGLSGPVREFVFARLTQVAHHFVNQSG
jgi:hemoglobin